ncbi:MULTISPECIES: hypothetical protein [unclassified Vibrio]|uniref:Uncharacterized protein n=1 Tax=Vibrio sp. HB236076 TaxID=3232307 RepID=A0AB39HDL3_9VIBR|nr:hypothetical protein [Vibrio sp. HB161653]MDP5253580.1 hypothetical protein [Vibrio sp. HB161653]
MTFATTPSVSYEMAHENHCHVQLVCQLAELSHHQQWVFFTAQCPRPAAKLLAQHQIRCDRVVHLSPSQYDSEFQVAIKAIESHTASAIVVSERLNENDKQQLQQRGALHHCQVFFLHDLYRSLH